jgi:integrase
VVANAQATLLDRDEWGDAYDDDDLVFARPDGAPLRPETVLRRFHALTEDARLPRVSLHDLRHLAVTVALGEGVPLSLVSKFARHSTTAITSDRYGHLSPEVSTAVADSIGSAHDAAAAELATERAAQTVRTSYAHEENSRETEGAVGMPRPL